jgi:transposase
LSIEVFVGNTQDPKTVASQILKIAERFEAREVTLVGDRGMLKSQQVEALGQRGFHYITAITKAEIRKLMNQGVIQMELFDEALAEVLTPGGIRYIIRRNPRRALEMVNSRQDKLAALRKKVEQRNDYLGGHPRAKVDTALRKLQEYATKLKITAWAIFSEQGNRQVQLEVNEAALAEDSKWDGCYVLKTDVPAHVAGKEIIHARYKDLALVEQAFRISKTVELEMRPIHVRLATRTRGHALVVMLAYRIVRELAHRWAHLDLTVQEGLNELTTLCSTELRTAKRHLCQQIPEPRPSVKSLLDAAGVKLPQALPCTGVTVSTKKKLQERRTST